MPKQDRCAQLKKEGAKTAKKIAHEREKDQKVAEKEELIAAQQAQEARSRNGGTKQPVFPSGKKPGMLAANSSFAKAALVTADHSDDEAHEAESPTEVYSPKEDKQKKETAASKKKQQQDRHKDEMQLLAEEQQAAMKARIVQRLLRVFVIGFVQELWSGGQTNGQNGKAAAKDAKPKQKKGKSTADQDSGLSFGEIRQKADVFGGPLMMLAFMVLLVAARLGEENYLPDHRADNEANFYDVMGVSSDASMITIRKAYKALALSWHPDKNPDCAECAEHFAKIGKAYETLSSPERRKAYDERRAPEGSLDSVVAVELTAEDFEYRVLRSNEVWIVQVYDPNDGLCQHFHPVFEDVAQAHQHIARFGRIDLTRQRGAISLLPQRVMMPPVVFRFARGHEPEIFLWQRHAEEQASAPFARFVLDHYPAAQRLANVQELKNWWAYDRPRVLVAGAGGSRGRQSMDFMHVQQLAHSWTEFFSFATTDAKLAHQALGLGSTQGNAWSVIIGTGKGAGARTETKTVKDAKDLTAAVKEAIERTVSNQAPSVTLRNHHQLCSPGSLSVKRSFCLMLVDTSDEQRVATVLSDLNVSLSNYHQEVLDLQESASEAESEGDEQVHIQPVRIMTSSSRMPWNPVAAGSHFHAVWGEADYAPAFLLELETRRIAPVKGPGLRDLYQQVAYEDLKFKVLPEGISIISGFPDPEATFRRELHHVLSTLSGGVAAFVLAAAAYAVLPELPLLTTVVSVASAAFIVLVSWPAACRRFVATLWCTFAASAYECQLHT